MTYSKRVFIEAVRELAFGGISGVFATVGPVTTHNVRLFVINNSTNVDLYISLDGSTDHFRIASNSFKLFDISANTIPQSNDAFFIGEQTQFWVKQTELGAPGSGRVWIEVIGAIAGG